MIRIGILGTDNSHSITFSRLFNVKSEKGYIAGGRVVAVYGLDDKRTAEVAEKGHIATIVKKPKDMIGLVDAAIVDFRHGSRHLKYARPLIEAGIPTFIDKPFTASIADAKKMVELARRKRVPITTFSTLRFAGGLDKFAKDVAALGKVKAVTITGPGDARDPHDGIFFYAVHQVEMMLEVFGDRIKSVRGFDYDGMLVAHVQYKNGMVVTINEINCGWRVFTATAHGENGETRFEQDSNDAGYVYGAKVFLKMFKTGKMPYAYKDLATSVRILAAIDKSMKSGGKEVKPA